MVILLSNPQSNNIFHFPFLVRAKIQLSPSVDCYGHSMCLQLCPSVMFFCVIDDDNEVSRLLFVGQVLNPCLCVMTTHREEFLGRCMFGALFVEYIALNSYMSWFAKESISQLKMTSPSIPAPCPANHEKFK